MAHTRGLSRAAEPSRGSSGRSSAGATAPLAPAAPDRPAPRSAACRRAPPRPRPPFPPRFRPRRQRVFFGEADDVEAHREPAAQVSWASARARPSLPVPGSPSSTKLVRYGRSGSRSMTSSTAVIAGCGTTSGSAPNPLRAAQRVMSTSASGAPIAAGGGWVRRLRRWPLRRGLASPALDPEQQIHGGLVGGRETILLELARGDPAAVRDADRGRLGVAEGASPGRARGRPSSRRSRGCGGRCTSPTSTSTPTRSRTSRSAPARRFHLLRPCRLGTPRDPPAPPLGGRWVMRYRSPLAMTAATTRRWGALGMGGPPYCGITCSMVKRVTPPEADALLAQGWTYLDVRSIPEFEGGHPAGAANVPLLHMQGGRMAPNPISRRS